MSTCLQTNRHQRRMRRLLPRRWLQLIQMKKLLLWEGKNFKVPSRQLFKATSGGYWNKFYNQNQFSKRNVANQNKSRQFSITFDCPEQRKKVVAEVNKPAGRLKIFLENWKSITSDSRILTWIKGYAIPFSKSVFQDSVPKEQAEIREHIEKLILKSVIVGIHVRSSFYLEFS